MPRRNPRSAELAWIKTQTEPVSAADYALRCGGSISAARGILRDMADKGSIERILTDGLERFAKVDHRKQLKDGGLSDLVLLHLRLHGAMTRSTLAEYVKADPNSLSRCLSLLLGRLLIGRQQINVKGGGRRFLYFDIDRGPEVLAKIVTKKQDMPETRAPNSVFAFAAMGG